MTVSLQLIVDNTSPQQQPEQNPETVLNILGEFFGEDDLIVLLGKCEQWEQQYPQSGYLDFAARHKVHFDFLFDAGKPEKIDENLKMANILLMLAYDRYMTSMFKPEERIQEAIDKDPFIHTNLDDLNALIDRILFKFDTPLGLHKGRPELPGKDPALIKADEMLLIDAINHNIDSVLKQL